MSNLSPESDSKLQLQPSAKDVALSDYERSLFQRGLAAPLQTIPKEFESWLIDRIAVLQPLIPIGQVVGFSQYTAQTGPRVDTQETTTSTSYDDLATVGPQLTGLPDGQYLFMFGCAMSEPGGAITYMGLKFNATEAQDSEAASWDNETGEWAFPTGVVTTTLAGGGTNTVTARYKTAGGTGSFAKRWLVGLKFANA